MMNDRSSAASWPIRHLVVGNDLSKNISRQPFRADNLQDAVLSGNRFENAGRISLMNADKIRLIQNSIDGHPLMEKDIERTRKTGNDPVSNLNNPSISPGDFRHLLRIIVDGLPGRIERHPPLLENLVGLHPPVNFEPGGADAEVLQIPGDSARLRSDPAVRPIIP